MQKRYKWYTRRVHGNLDTGVLYEFKTDDFNMPVMAIVHCFGDGKFPEIVPRICARIYFKQKPTDGEFHSISDDLLDLCITEVGINYPKNMFMNAEYYLVDVFPKVLTPFSIGDYTWIEPIKQLNCH